MVVGQPEVQADRPHHRVDEHLWGFAIGKAAKLLQPPGQLLCRWRHMEHGAVGVVHHHLFPWWPEPAGIPGVIQRVRAHQPVQIQHQFRCQRLLPQLPDALHRQEVVEDHPLGAVPGRPAAADHRLGHIPRCGGALHLRGGDRLLHQRAQKIAIAGGANGDALGSHRIDTGLHVDLMQPLEQHRRLREPERLAVSR